jgi:hypothetical protein
MVIVGLTTRVLTGTFGYPEYDYQPPQIANGQTQANHKHCNAIGLGTYSLWLGYKV